VPEDDGIAGGRGALRDNNTTSAFIAHRYALKEVMLEAGQEPVTAARDLVAKGIGYIAVNLPSDVGWRLEWHAGRTPRVTT
jgi:hypothetical protein